MRARKKMRIKKERKVFEKGRFVQVAENLYPKEKNSKG